MSIYSHLESLGIIERCEKVDCPLASTEYLQKAHSKEHIDKVLMTKFSRQVTKSGEITLQEKKGKDIHYIGSDVYCNKNSSDCALMAAGASIESCDKIFMFY